MDRSLAAWVRRCPYRYVVSPLVSEEARLGPPLRRRTVGIGPWKIWTIVGESGGPPVERCIEGLFTTAVANSNDTDLVVPVCMITEETLSKR